MSDQIEEVNVTATGDAAEIQTLRRVKDSLHQTAQGRKARIDELEAEVATLKTQLAASNRTVHKLTVGAPITAMAKEISIVPLLFQREYEERLGIVEKDGVLLVTKAGEVEPLLIDGRPIPFTSNALSKLLASDALDADSRLIFSALITGSKASGSGATGANRGGNGMPGAAPKPPKEVIDSASQFGIR